MQPNLNPLQLTPAQLAANKAAIGNAQPSNGGGSFIGDTIDNIGSFLHLPEMGISEALAGGNPTTNTANPVGVDITQSPLSLGLGTTAPYNSAKSKLTTNTPAAESTQTAPQQIVGYDINSNPVYSNTYGGYGGTATYTSADEQAQYADQIANINKLLGLTETQKASGLGRISSEFDAAKLKQDKSIADQRLQNEQSKEQGINEVGNFANTSINNLRRLLQGGNAGRSSVGQILAPYMVGKAADTRRTGVLNTAGENARLLDTTQNELTQSLENQRKKSEEDFVSSILNKQNELTGQRQGLEMNKALATGAGYGAARTAAQNSTNELATRQNELTSLFDKYKPNYTTKEVAPLSTYQVDPSTLITNNQNSPTQSSYYLSQFKKKQQGL